MTEGTTPPRSCKHPVYFVLAPEFIKSQQLFLSKNGVIFFHGDIPAEFLRLQDQLPTLACNVLRPGRGHTLPPSVTGGTWPADVSYEHVNVRRVSVLFLEVPFLKTSELRHGSSWARRFLKIMEGLFLAYPWQERLTLIHHSNQFMLYCQKALIRERNLNKMTRLWKIHRTAIKTCRTLSAERGICRSMGAAAFLIR